jgi:singapore isolate B (sub-type 7) whole genome shotgun sequence assembly, scaffold_1
METSTDGYSKTQFGLLVATIYLTMLMMGLTEMSCLVALPMMKTYFNVSDDVWGLFSSILGGCYLFGCFCASFILKYCGFKVMFMSAFIVDIVGCVCLQVTNSFWQAAICIFVIWTSTGLFEISTNSASTATFKKNTATWMMFMQCCFGIGATLSPIVCRFGVHVLKHDFFSCYVAIAIIVSFFFLLLIFVPIPIKFVEGEDKSDIEGRFPSSDYSWCSTLKSGVAWICAFSMGMMEAVEVGNNTWAPLYLQDVLHLDPLKELVVFGTWLQILFTVSRLISGPLIDCLGYFTSLYISNVICALLLIIGFLLGKNGPYAFVFMSFFYAWFWPTNVCAFMKIFKNNAPLASSHIIVMQGLLTLPISTILGTINRKFGQQWAYHLLLVFSVLSLIAITLMLLAYKRIEKKETESLVEH